MTKIPEADLEAINQRIAAGLARLAKMDAENPRPAPTPQERDLIARTKRALDKALSED